LTSAAVEGRRAAGFCGVNSNGCPIRGASLDGVVGVNRLKGVMPWADVLASAAAPAGALGIVVKFD
jgi:hypothetical protein